jgi:hypothetical protein
MVSRTRRVALSTDYGRRNNDLERLPGVGFPAEQKMHN